MISAVACRSAAENSVANKSQSDFPAASVSLAAKAAVTARTNAPRAGAARASDLAGGLPLNKRRQHFRFRRCPSRVLCQLFDGRCQAGIALVAGKQKVLLLPLAQIGGQRRRFAMPLAAVIAVIRVGGGFCLAGGGLGGRYSSSEPLTGGDLAVDSIFRRRRRRVTAFGFSGSA